MSTPILATKLFIPPLRPKAVPRARLIERLNEGLHGKLTLISAPAGFGKTTLVSEWLAASSGRRARPAAWLSLDEGDSDPTRFLAYLIAALQTLALSEGEGTVAKLGEGVLGMLQSPQPPPTEALLTALLNEITTIPNGFILVLDDYHLIDAPSIDQALAFLLDHLPPQIHLVITTREDPQLPLARYRARGHMTELRAADLRFTPTEAADFLNQVMGLNLAAEDVTALEARTEGWIAGLQLAALSLRGRADVGQFVRAFAGDNRYIVDYLVEEVLQRQPERVRSFLLQTAILDRLNGPLCDAVTGQEEGRARLEALERGNFFVVPLDEKRHWYRYHHLFTDVLHMHLTTEQPDQVPALHRRASAWYADNGLPVAALKTRVWVAQGRLSEALGWAQEQGLSAHDDLSYRREFEHITLARVLLAQVQNDRTGRSMLEAVGLLERLLQAGKAGARTRSVIEILVLQALAHQTQGDLPAALIPLQQGLTLAEPEGYVRMFVDEGPPMAQLLLEAAARGFMPAYTAELLAAFGVEQPGDAGQSPLPTALASQPLIEPLSQRELEVLRLFKTELSGPEIACALVVALSTVRTHTKGIYSKLNVNDRRAAVKRAAELNLI